MTNYNLGSFASWLVENECKMVLQIDIYRETCDRGRLAMLTLDRRLWEGSEAWGLSNTYEGNNNEEK